MSFIINSSNPFISVKLTEKGREQLSMGKLNFTYWGIGDSEINYERESIVDANNLDSVLSGTSKIMRPVDRQPNIKSFITTSGATTPYQDILPTNLNVIKAIVNNEATERGFFTNTLTNNQTLTASTYSPYSELILNTTITGGTILTLSTTTPINVGDLILLKATNNNSGTATPIDTIKPLPNIWFRVDTKPSSTKLSVDRVLPNLSSYSGYSQVIIYKGGEVHDTIGTGNTTAYWDSGTLSFDSNASVSCNDVPVWNMNNIWSENLAGMLSGNPFTTLYEDYKKFGSYQYLGEKNPYFEYANISTASTEDQLTCYGSNNSYLDEISKSVSILHYTNNTISNMYGEFFHIDNANNKTLRITIPNLMYHRINANTSSGLTMGMSFIASGVTKYIGNSDIEYIDLIEDPTMIKSSVTPLIVGKVFPQLKTVVIENDEIVASMSYKSNRNWTLPSLSATLQSATGGTSTGILIAGYTMYLTYMIGNTSATGLTSSLPCQTYTKITNQSTEDKDVAFKIGDVNLLPFMRKIESGGYDGYGFYGNQFKVLYQIVPNSTNRPNSNSWKEYDFTSTAITTISGNTINPLLLENQIPLLNGFILDKLKDLSATTFDLNSVLNLPATTTPNNLQFGDERFFYGNLNTYIGATIYKTIFNININSSVFNSTSNPTRSKILSTNPPNIKVSEVGIYDLDKNLVCIGKISKPIPLISNTIMIEASLDF